MVLELREFLSEHVYTCFFTHYYFEHLGQRLNDYTELSELSLSEEPKIFMRPGRIDLDHYCREIRREEYPSAHQARKGDPEHALAALINTLRSCRHSSTR